jgi:TPR repeat protein
VDAVGQWRFEPATKEGQPVRVHAQIEVTFRLENHDKKNVKRPKGTLLQRADRGEGAAQALLGINCWLGQAVPRDLVQAYKWLSLAAESGTEGAADDLDALTKTLSPEQLMQAQDLLRGARKP